MIRNHEPDGEIRAAIAQAKIEEHILPALQSARDERAGANPRLLIAAVTQFTGVVGQGWTADGRQEFIGLAVDDLLRLPGAITLDALREARFEVNDGRNLLNWVYKRVEHRMRRLDVEIKRLQLLEMLSAS